MSEVAIRSWTSGPDLPFSGCRLTDFAGRMVQHACQHMLSSPEGVAEVMRLLDHGLISDPTGALQAACPTAGHRREAESAPAYASGSTNGVHQLQGMNASTNGRLHCTHAEAQPASPSPLLPEASLGDCGDEAVHISASSKPLPANGPMTNGGGSQTQHAAGALSSSANPTAQGDAHHHLNHELSIAVSQVQLDCTPNGSSHRPASDGSQSQQCQQHNTTQDASIHHAGSAAAQSQQEPSATGMGSLSGSVGSTAQIDSMQDGPSFHAAAPAGSQQASSDSATDPHSCTPDGEVKGGTLQPGRMQSADGDCAHLASRCAAGHLGITRDSHAQHATVAAHSQQGLVPADQMLSPLRQTELSAQDRHLQLSMHSNGEGEQPIHTPQPCSPDSSPALEVPAPGLPSLVQHAPGTEGDPASHAAGAQHILSQETLGSARPAAPSLPSAAQQSHSNDDAQSAAAISEHICNQQIATPSSTQAMGQAPQQQPSVHGSTAHNAADSWQQRADKAAGLHHQHEAATAWMLRHPMGSLHPEWWIPAADSVLAHAVHLRRGEQCLSYFPGSRPVGHPLLLRCHPASPSLSHLICSRLMS